GVGDGEAAAQPLARAHGDRAHDAVAELLLNLEGQVAVLELERVVDLGDGLAGELDVHHRADDLDDPACRARAHGRSVSRCLSRLESRSYIVRLCGPKAAPTPSESRLAGRSYIARSRLESRSARATPRRRRRRS